MDDLVAFLRARIDEDEQVARKAASLCGCHPSAPEWAFDEKDEDGRILIVDHPHPAVMKLRLERRWNRSYQDMFMASHIARHDPARVLAEVKAKRLLIAWLERYEDRRLDANNWAMDDGETGLALLAVPYADHPDYRAEWAPAE